MQIGEDEARKGKSKIGANGKGSKMQKLISTILTFTFLASFITSVLLPARIAEASPDPDWRNSYDSSMQSKRGDLCFLESKAGGAVGKPVLISPENGKIIYDDTPTFTWTVGANADNHRFLLDNEITFESPIENRLIGATTTTYTVTTKLALDNYWWKVVAIKGENENHSDIWTFQLLPAPPLEFGLTLTIIGMVCVFSVMGLLIAICLILKKVFKAPPPEAEAPVSEAEKSVHEGKS